MVKKYSTLCSILVLFSYFIFTGVSSAQTKPSSVIAVLDPVAISVSETEARALSGNLRANISEVIIKHHSKIKIQDTQNPQEKPVLSIPDDEQVNPKNVIAGIKMVSIPGGTFRMGNIQRMLDSIYSLHVHEVTLDGFEMSIYEITQGQYKKILGSIPVRIIKGDVLPVEEVNWYDAIKFCNALSDNAGFERCYYLKKKDFWIFKKKYYECDYTNNGYRLPTEAEWEYACRAGTETNYYTGNLLSLNGEISADLDLAGWYGGNCNKQSHPVGQKKPNAFGLYDMHGNVWEWCNDIYGKDYYYSSQVINPTGPISGKYRVIRGGGWSDSAMVCRSARRARSNPSGANFSIGFRIVRRK